MKKYLVILIALFSVALTACVSIWQQQGYANEADYNFAKTLGNSTPQRIARLKAYGIQTKADVDKVDLEITSTGYSKNTDWDTTFLYLKDREDAKKAGISTIQQRDARLKVEAIAENERLAKVKRDREEFAKQYPFKAIIRCESGGRHFGSLGPCFFKGPRNAETELELRNGSEYKLYKSYEIDRAFDRGDSNGTVIPLRNNFELKVQNSSEHFVLTIVVVETATNKEIFKRSASQYGVIRVRN